MFRVEKLRKAFGGLMAVNGVSFALNKGEISAIIGPNGAGKTTLFNLLTGHLKPDSGTVYFQDREITALSPHKICHAGIGRYRTFDDDPQERVVRVSGERAQWSTVPRATCGVDVPRRPQPDARPPATSGPRSRAARCSAPRPRRSRPAAVNPSTRSARRRRSAACGGGARARRSARGRGTRPHRPRSPCTSAPSARRRPSDAPITMQCAATTFTASSANGAHNAETIWRMRSS